MNSGKAQQFERKTHSIILGGYHTYAKGDDQYPALAPDFIIRGEGSHVWDIDGNEFIKYGMGLRTVTLGHAFTRPSTTEVECTEEVVNLIEGAEMVKFAQNELAAAETRWQFAPNMHSSPRMTGLSVPRLWQLIGGRYGTY